MVQVPTEHWHMKPYEQRELHQDLVFTLNDIMNLRDNLGRWVPVGR